MSDLDALVTERAALIVGALALVALALAIGLLVTLRRVRRLADRLDALTRGEDGRSLAGVLDAHLEQVHQVSRRQEALDGHAASLDAQAARSVQGVGLVRFNTFEDTGGNQSFTLALVDPTGDGVIVNSLHARSQSRLYARAVHRGAAEGTLSAQEAEALQLASARARGR